MLGSNLYVKIFLYPAAPPSPDVTVSALNFSFASFAVEARELPGSSASADRCQSPSISLQLRAWPVHFLAGHFGWGKFGCTFPMSGGEQRAICYTASPSSCSLVAELQVSKMMAITESPVVCAVLDFSIMSRSYDLGEACFA